MASDSDRRAGDLERFAIDVALDAAWTTEFWIPADPDYGYVDYFEAAAARNLDLLHGLEDLGADVDRRGILPATEGEQARLVTDGGQADDDRRLWRCPTCGLEENRHHAEKKRPFCDECESRDAVLIEMRPIGLGREKFYDEEGYAINP